jgi:hypothetical protein
LDIEEPVACRYLSAFHFHATLSRMLGSALIWNEIVQVGEPRQKHLLASSRMMEAFHGEQLPFAGVMGLIQEGTRGGHLWVCEHYLPARLLDLKPAPYPLAIGWPRRGGDVVRKVAQSLTQRKDPQALALTAPVHESVKLRA